MKVFILTEGSRDIGFGHITRCTALYQAFEEKEIKPRLIVNGDTTVKELIRDKRCELFNWSEEDNKLFSLIKNADTVIIDSYLAHPECYKKISGLVKIAVYIDDNKRIDYPKGVVVNGTIHAEELDYPQRSDIHYLLGNQYIPLRKEFWDVPDKDVRENIQTVMITFGGDDARNITPHILKLANETLPELTKKVIIGKGFDNIEQIKSLKDETTELIYYPDAAGMKKVMLESDIAISASGQTSYELARVGVPTIAIAIADNQMNNVRGWQKAGFIEYAGSWEEKSVFANIIQKIELLQSHVLRHEKSKRGKTLIDGRGAIRIISHCFKAFFDESIDLRKAEFKDMQNIYELSNDNQVRKYSFHSDKIIWKHTRNGR